MAVDKVNNIVEQEIPGSRAIVSASGNVDAIVGISECSNIIDKIVNVDVRQGIANGRAVGRAPDNVSASVEVSETKRVVDKS